jgi:hypothetical protein
MQPYVSQRYFISGMKCALPSADQIQQEGENMALKALALACALLTGNASASVLIDFEGVGNGATVNDFYNGGTDSLGNSGTNYGVHFSGGLVRYNQFGAYVYGPVTATFSTTLSGSGVSFMGDGLFLDTMSTVCYSSGSCEPFLFESMSYQPPTNGQPSGTVPGWYPGKVWPGNLPYADIVSITFNTLALDDIRFNGTAPATEATVPEPTSIALLSLGVLGLFGARRRQSGKSQNV